MNTSSVADAGQALATIKGYPAQLETVAARITGIPTGPWGISVSCHYGPSCCESTATYSMAIDLSSRVLTSTLAELRQHASTFTGAYAEVDGWVRSLPTFSSTFDTNADRIVALVSSLPARASPTPSQRLELEEWFQAIIDGLTSGRKQLTAGSGAIGTFIEQQKALVDQLTTAGQNLASQSEAEQQQIAESIAQKPCGQSEANAQFASVKQVDQQSLGAFQQVFSSLRSNTDTVSNALATVLSMVVGYDAQIAEITKTLASADGGQLSNFLTKLDVQTAKKLWNTLAAEASGQPGGS